MTNEPDRRDDPGSDVDDPTDDAAPDHDDVAERASQDDRGLNRAVPTTEPETET